ncbi:MAG TPA: hypothetical protein VFB00_02515 [Terriglobales bacterium]|nr:hypothetical protein [Terriglobales bacterium]
MAAPQPVPTIHWASVLIARQHAQERTDCPCLSCTLVRSTLPEACSPVVPHSIQSIADDVEQARSLVEDIVDLIKRGFLEVDETGDEPRFALTAKGKAAL